jgi:MFS family permease
MTSETTAPALGLKQVAAVGAGNALAFYDFLTYAFFATQIGDTFFPVKNSDTRLLISLVVFGVSFLARPIGAMLIGTWADRAGRRPAMVLTFTMMGVSILGLALTPSYAAIGIASPIIAVTFRLLQAVALGGEVGPSTAYLIEAASPERRGLFAGFAAATQDGGVLFAGIVGTVLSSLMTTQQLTNYGWRIAFIIGASIVPFGLIMRRRLTETLVHEEAPAPLDYKPYIRITVLGLLMLAAATIGNYVLDFMTTYAGHTLHMNITVAFGATVVIGLFNVTTDMLGGWLTDRFGRRPQMIFCYGLLAIVAVPLFWLIVRYRDAQMLFLGSAFISTMLGIGGTPVVTAITESIPPRIRSGAMGTIYALSISVFGGSAQPMVQWLLIKTGNPLVPGYYMAAALVVGVIAALLLHESAPRILAKRAVTAPA